MKLVTHRRLLELLHYDPETGAFTWHARKLAEFPDARTCNSWNAKNAGKAAGSVDKLERYVRIGLDGRHYWAHRLAWFYMKRRWPKHDVDHKDRDRANNRFVNLRSVTRAHNLQNQVAPAAGNKSGVRGVNWDEARGKWKVELSVENRTRFVGRFDDLESAAAARKDAVRRLHPGSLA